MQDQFGSPEPFQTILPSHPSPTPNSDLSSVPWMVIYLWTTSMSLFCPAASDGLNRWGTHSGAQTIGRQKGQSIVLPSPFLRDTEWQYLCSSVKSHKFSKMAFHSILWPRKTYECKVLSAFKATCFKNQTLWEKQLKLGCCMCGLSPLLLTEKLGVQDSFPVIKY